MRLRVSIPDEFSNWCDHQLELVLICLKRYRETQPDPVEMAQFTKRIEELSIQCNALQDQVTSMLDTGAIEAVVTWIESAVDTVSEQCKQLYGEMAYRVE